MPSNVIPHRDAVRIGLLGFTALPLLVRAASAATGEASSAPDVVRVFAAALLSVMKAGTRATFAQRFAVLAPAVDRGFDLDAILRVSVGSQWSGMSADQQAALARTFRRYTVANFVANFDNYSGEAMTVSPDARGLPNGDQVVDTRIAGGSGAPLLLSYVMRDTPAGWRAVDVLADGAISRVATQRSDFRGLLNRGGSAALLASLEDKVSALSGGSLA